MKANKYKRGSNHCPGLKQIKKSLCAAFIVCLLPGGVSADIPTAELPSDGELPTVSHHVEIGAAERQSSPEMPTLAGESVEISAIPKRAPDVGATTSHELSQAKAQVENVELSPQDKDTQTYLMSASLTPASYTVPSQELKAMRVKQVSTREAGGTMAVDNEIDDQLQLPYALALALMAIIGLVPVSRRSH